MFTLIVPNYILLIGNLLLERLNLCKVDSPKIIFYLLNSMDVELLFLKFLLLKESLVIFFIFGHKAVGKHRDFFKGSLKGLLPVSVCVCVSAPRNGAIRTLPWGERGEHGDLLVTSSFPPLGLVISLMPPCHYLKWPCPSPPSPPTLSSPRHPTFLSSFLPSSLAHPSRLF